MTRSDFICQQDKVLVNKFSHYCEFQCFLEKKDEEKRKYEETTEK